MKTYKTFIAELKEGVVQAAHIFNAKREYDDSEREVKKKDAGITTTVFICVGAAIYTFLSGRIEGVLDSSRVIAQIVSGIGFIGGGVIIFDKDKIQGLTSASIIWLVAAIGILNGLQMHGEAIFASLTVVVVDFLFGKFKWILRNRGN